MKRPLAGLFLLMILFSLLTACTEPETQTTAPQPLTAAQAQVIVWEDLGITAEDVGDLVVHMGEMEEGPAFSIMFTYQGQKYEYVILAEDGRILIGDIVA